MRTLLLVSALAGLSTARAADPPRPLAEKYLHAGELAAGEQALLLALERSPKDDEARFGLGVVQFVRAVERLGQALHEYGAKSESASMPFLRLPVPKNDKPSAISYRAFGRMLDAFVADLARAEKTLAKVTDDKVKLRLRLADVKFDLTGEGQPTDKFLDILVRLNRGRFEFLKDNPEFLIGFDRGDVAWLRAYCHLLSAMVEGYRAFDLEAHFHERVKAVFPKVDARPVGPADDDKVVVADGSRLGRFRKHFLEVCRLNRETWRYVRAETDDDHEWLPHPKQKGVLGLPVRDEQIDAWLAMVQQVEDFLNGERLLPSILVQFIDRKAVGRGFNAKSFFTDPPRELSAKKIEADGIDAKYLEAEGKKPPLDLDAIFTALRLFQGPMGVAYMAWFN